MMIMDLCRYCKYLYSRDLREDTEQKWFCKKNSSGGIPKLILHLDREGDVQWNQKFEAPETCPFILEHTLGERE